MKNSIKTTMEAPLASRLTILSSIALVACFALAGSSARAQTYSVTDLGTLPSPQLGVMQSGVSTPAAINNQGQIAGTSGKFAFRYNSASTGPMENLGNNPMGSTSRGFGINGTGMVVGDSTFTNSGVADGSISRAAIFSNGSVADLGTLTGSLPYSRANGINASKQVVGFSGPKADDIFSRAFIWSASTGMVDLGTLGGAYAQASAINDIGYVTGTSQTAQTADGAPGVSHAFICNPTSMAITSMRDLGTLGGNSSYGTFINANNHVVGYSTLNKSSDGVHAFLHDGAKILDLGTLGGDQSVALGINVSDQVVGYSYFPATHYSPSGPMEPRQVAFVYRQGVMVDLNQLIGTAAQNQWLLSATAINDRGQIVASALQYSSNALHAVLLTPVTLPALPDGNISATYDINKKLLVVEAHISGGGSSAQLPIAYDSNVKLIGTLNRISTDTYRGTFSVATNPIKVKVVTSWGVSASADVVVITPIGVSGRGPVNQ
jgi:probable HAF family extracellular repeat protein